MNIIRALTRAKLDDAHVSEPARAEWILAGNPLDFLAALADGEDDAAVARNLAAGDEEIAGVVVLLQERHVRPHVRVDLGERHLVVQFDHEHRATGPWPTSLELIGRDMVNPQDLPVMCTLAPETLAARKAALLPGLVARADRVEPLPDGIRLRFAATELPAIASVIESERQCCRFLRFEIVVQPGAGPIEVTLTGPPGTRDFVDALISG